LTSREEEELCELQSDHTFNMKFAEPSLDKFCISLIEEYPAIHRKALNILRQFSTLYVCKKASSFSTSFKSKVEIISVEDELCMYLSKVRPRIKYLCSKQQAQFYIKEANFILHFSLKNNTLLLDDVFVRIAFIYLMFFSNLIIEHVNKFAYHK
jgi:hypothetical protein